MNRQLISFLAVMVLVVPTTLSAQEVSADQRAAIAALGGQYFRAVVTGDAKTLMASTTQDFHYTSLEGQTLTSDTLASKWKIMRIEYGGEHGSTKLRSIQASGKTLTAIFEVQTAADTNSTGEGITTTALYAVHRVVWVNSAAGWKIASDSVLQSDISY
jgi:ketosteroid isomerase-like protein